MRELYTGGRTRHRPLAVPRLRCLVSWRHGMVYAVYAASCYAVSASKERGEERMPRHKEDTMSQDQEYNPLCVCGHPQSKHFAHLRGEILCCGGLCVCWRFRLPKEEQV